MGQVTGCVSCSVSENDRDVQVGCTFDMFGNIVQRTTHACQGVSCSQQ